MTPSPAAGAEEWKRLQEVPHGRAPWRHWGPYLAERAWGTVREDYSPDGEAWEFFPFDHARSRAYRWNEDGLGGICDDRQTLCLAFAFWNGVDPFLKERIFGLDGHQGNHGEDAKECWWYLDSTPTHSWMRWRYAYPQQAFPYAQLVEENARRTRLDPEFELVDTGALAGGRYFEITADYAKATPEDILIEVTARNCGPAEATLHLLPTLWFRNTWSWADDRQRPEVSAEGGCLRAVKPRARPAAARGHAGGHAARLRQRDQRPTALGQCRAAVSQGWDQRPRRPWERHGASRATPAPRELSGTGSPSPPALRRRSACASTMVAPRPTSALASAR